MAKNGSKWENLLIIGAIIGVGYLGYKAISGITGFVGGIGGGISDFFGGISSGFTNLFAAKEQEPYLHEWKYTNGTGEMVTWAEYQLRYAALEERRRLMEIETQRIIREINERQAREIQESGYMEGMLERIRTQGLTPARPPSISTQITSGNRPPISTRPDIIGRYSY